MTTRQRFNVVYDHQIFSLQQFGGISRYFCELSSRVDRAPEFRAHVVGGIHFNRHLADCSVSQSGMFVPLRSQRLGRLHRAANKILAPILTRAAAPSLLHRTYYSWPGGPSRVPVIVTVYDMIHELFANSFAASDRTSANKKLSVDEATHVLCISESTAQDLMRLFGVSRDKISVTHLGYSEMFGHPAPLDEPSLHPRPYLLYVGHRGGYKNFRSAVQAYAASSRLTQAFDMLAFGGFPLAKDELAWFAALGLRRGSVVHLMGPDEMLARAYRHAHVFVYPSLYEGFGIPPLEAMASGCAVACSNSSSVPEVVGDAAILFNAGNVEAMRDALERVCFDDVLRADLIKAGLERVRCLSWDRCADETVAVYRRLVAE